MAAMNQTPPPINRGSSNDYHHIPVTEKQLAYARKIAARTGAVLPWDAQQDRRVLSDWIDQHRKAMETSRFLAYPSSKQVAFAERLARIKRREIPQECFRDRVLMSRWIDANR